MNSLGYRFLRQASRMHVRSLVSQPRYGCATATLPRNFTVNDKTGIELWAVHKPDALRGILQVFHDLGINLTSIESKLIDKPRDEKKEHLVRFQIHMDGTHDKKKLKKIFEEGELKRTVRDWDFLPIAKVPWFPKKITDLDLQQGALQERKEEVAKDHPQLSDQIYRVRRDELAAISSKSKILSPIPTVEYKPEEYKTWAYIVDNLIPLQEAAMCRPFNQLCKKMMKECGISRDRIPQLRDVSDYLYAETGFRLKPVPGILSQREFLNALAHRVFPSTQYLRHHSTPEYTPEPDIVHEILGHAVMFADKDFADMSQLIGLYTLGANPEQLKRMAALYWYTVEFGAVKDGDKIKGYGAGIASSFGEIRYFLTDKPKFEPLEPMKKLPLDYPVQTYQPVFYYGKSIEDIKGILLDYGEYVKKPIKTYYDYKKGEVEVDRAMETYETDD